MYSRKILLIILIVVSGLSFRSFFTSSSLSLGDAPYLSAELLKTYVHEPSAWSNIGTIFGGVNQFIWIWPYMALVSIFGLLTQISPELLIRIFFYFPAVLCAGIGSYLFASRFSKSEVTKFVATLIYTVNTYFLLVVDGGQVGVALAYGLFPLVLVTLVQQSTEYKRRSFFVSLASLQLITLADPRIALICLGLTLLITGRTFKKLIPPIVVWVLLNMYWVYPLISNREASLSTGFDQFTSFLNGLFFYAPHWSQNIYGVVSYPTLAFVIFPLLVVWSLRSDRKHIKLFLIWLVFVFLIKGTTEPFGFIYQKLTLLPFGSAFRDSTKFFIPAVLVGGFLVGEGVTFLNKKSSLAPILFFLIFLMGILPAIKGDLNFALSGRETTDDIETVNKLVADGKRTVWINERDPRGVVSQSESINSFDLAQMRPFASLNVGDHDRLNFLNATESASWLNVFGVSHLVLNGNPRERSFSNESQKDWDRTKELIQSRNFLSATNDSRVFENKNPLQQFYGVDKMLFVIGNDDIYQKINAKYPGSVPENTGVTFIEDGKFNSKDLLLFASESGALVDDGGGKPALTLSLLTSYFHSTNDAITNNFAKYRAGDYLKYKYELLIRDIAFTSFDYGLGVAFSTQPNEKIDFSLQSVPGDSVLAVRSQSTGKARISADDNSVEASKSATLQWTLLPVKTTNGQVHLNIQNIEGVTIVNAVALIPKAEYEAAEKTAAEIMDHFPLYKTDTLPKTLFEKKPLPIVTKENGTTRWSVERNPEAHWLIFTNRFSPGFALSKDQLSYQSIPVYSSLNAFYLRPEWQISTLTYSGQTNLRWGIYFTVVTLLSVVIFALYTYSHEN